MFRPAITLNPTTPTVVEVGVCDLQFGKLYSRLFDE